MLFFKFIFLVLILAVATVAIGIGMLVFKLRRMAEKLTGKVSGSAAGRASGASCGPSGSSRNRDSSAGNGTIYEERKSAVTQPKIIPEDEGEYVEFEEVKD